MSNTTKTRNNLSDLQRELKLLRSFVIGVAGRDKEGEYHPEFVQKILNAVSKKPTHTFVDSQTFLRQLQK